MNRNGKCIGTWRGSALVTKFRIGDWYIEFMTKRCRLVGFDVYTYDYVFGRYRYFGLRGILHGIRYRDVSKFKRFRPTISRRCLDIDGIAQKITGGNIWKRAGIDHSVE